MYDVQRIDIKKENCHGCGTMTSKDFPSQGGGDTPRPVLLLQGGGALGAYQAGAFEALAAHDFMPNWVIGVSIGAINASIIAGNPPERRVERLRMFWENVTAPTAMLQQLHLPLRASAEQQTGAAMALLQGQPGFFRPWLPFDWISKKPLSYYDTAQLRQTLVELIDFDLLNSGMVRLSLGAVQVKTGNMVYFDTNKIRIEAEHIMASGALPPGFPAVQIDGEPYWDGGLVSNTPLSYFMAHEPRHDSLVFQIDLFPARGLAPQSLDEVTEREKDIRFSSRTRLVTTEERKLQNLRRQLSALLERLPPELRDDEATHSLRAFACPARVDLVHLIYRPERPQGSQKDYQFDRGSYLQRWKHGRTDTDAAMTKAPWKHSAQPGVGMRTFDIHTGQHRNFGER
jgi:NTE family protein